MNICARSIGGYMSDVFYRKWGIRGRLWALFMQTLAMGLLLIGFSTATKDQGGIAMAMVWLFLWAFLTSMTCGGLYSIVPFIEPSAVGGVSGIVGAGGNAGALFGMAIMGIGYRPGFLCIGFMSIMSAMLVPLLWMPGQGSMLAASKNAGVELKFKDDVEANKMDAPNQMIHPQQTPRQTQDVMMLQSLSGPTAPAAHPLASSFIPADPNANLVGELTAMSAMQQQQARIMQEQIHQQNAAIHQQNAVLLQQSARLASIESELSPRKQGATM